MDKIAIVIPTYNEIKIIDETLRSLLKIVSAEDIYLVDDASYDTTPDLANLFIDNILSLDSNYGKAKALNIAIEKFKLTERYDFIFPLDADTKIKPDFLKSALKFLKKDKENEIVAVIGKIVGTTRSWITAYRLWEYEIGQSLHKKAQDKEKAIFVCSGCVTIYRSSLFKKISFSSETMTEDMDLTFQIHRLNLGKIVYCESSIATTQDPLGLSDFIKQIERWFTGFWQCVYKHKIPFGKQSLDFEVTLNSIEGLFGGFIVLGSIFLIPWFVNHNQLILLTALAIDFISFFLPSIILISLKYKTFKLFLYMAHFYFLRIISSLVFLKAYFKILIGQNFNKWNRVNRYSFK